MVNSTTFTAFSSYLPVAETFCTSARSGYSWMTSLFKSHITPNESNSAFPSFIATSLLSRSTLCLTATISLVALCILGIRYQSTGQEDPQVINTASALPLATVVTSSTHRKAPIGMPNGGNHCCFISALQVLMNTPSWKDVLEHTALQPVLTAYEQKDTSGLRFESIREQIDIYEEGHARNQEDPAAYIRALADAAQKQQVVNVCYLDPRGKLVSDRGVKEEDSLISVGIPKTAVNPSLEQLLEGYFDSTIAGQYSAEADKILEVPKQQTLIKKTFIGEAPEDLMIQIKRFGMQTPTHPEPTQSFFQTLWSFFLNLFRSSPAPEPTSNEGCKDYKIEKAIQTPLELTLKQQWVQGATKPTRYVCQGFLSHFGSQLRSGHYVSYVLKEGQWYECNDNQVRAISLKEAEIALKTSYIVSYRKVS